MNELPFLKKYKEVCPDTVRRIYETELAKGRNPKDAEKQTKTELHRITGAFLTPAQVRLCEKLLEAGDLTGTLAMHSSTKERLDGIDTFYQTLFDGHNVQTVLDLACGLNPLYLASAGYTVTGMDISGDCVNIMNAWADKMQWKLTALCRDLLCEDSFPKADVTLIMKLLPLMEQQKKGSALEILNKTTSDTVIVTFPTKSLGGRNVGMEQHYTDWFEALISGSYSIIKRQVISNELCYTIRRCDTDRQSE